MKIKYASLDISATPILLRNVEEGIPFTFDPYSDKIYFRQGRDIFILSFIEEPVLVSYVRVFDHRKVYVL